MRMGTAQKPEMKMIADLVEEDKSRITLAGGSFPDLSGDGQITKKDILIGRGVIDRDDKQSGGLAAILEFKLKLHQYNEMMAYLTRPKFQDGGPVVPPEKPSSDILFKRKINNLLTGFYGTHGFLVDEIQSVLDEAEKKGVLSKQEGTTL